MPWKRATFKEQQVWAQVNADGSPALDGGRLPVRYSRSAGAKVYLATPSRVGQGSPIAQGAPLNVHRSSGTLSMTIHC